MSASPVSSTVRLVADPELERAVEHVDELDLARQRGELVAGARAGGDLRLDRLEPRLVAQRQQVAVGRRRRLAGGRSCLRTSAGSGSCSKMWPSRTPSASQIRAIDASEGAVRSRSSWLMKPFVRPVAAASCSIVSPRSRRSERTRAPTLGVSLRAARGVARGMCRSYGGLPASDQRQLPGDPRPAAILFVSCTARTRERIEEVTEGVSS